MVKKITYRYKTSINGEHADSHDCRKAFDYWLISQCGGINHIPVALYKYKGVDINTKTFVKKTKKKKTIEQQQRHLENEFVIELGGPFEEIGGQDETLGGGSQKVG